jgi:hypothetical protein
MVHLFELGLTIVISFVVGVAFGATNSPSVTVAIAALTGAEQKAKDTLAEITAHKAS